MSLKLKIFTALVLLLSLTAPCQPMRLNSLYLENKTDRQIKFVLINTRDFNCEIGKIKVNSGYHVGTGKKKRLLIIKNGYDEVFVYYIGFVSLIWDLDYIDENLFRINAELLPDNKIYIINKNDPKNYSKQPNPPDLPIGQFPIQPGYYGAVQKSNLASLQPGIALDLDNPNFDYTSYDLDEHDAQMLKACFSIFN